MATARSILRVRLLVSVSLLTAGFFAAGVPVGNADPRPSVSQVQARIAALDDRAEQYAEAYNAARGRLATLQRRTVTAQDRLDRARAASNRLRGRIAAAASAAYRGGGLDEIVTLVTTKDPASFLDRAVSLDHVSRYQADALFQYSVAQHSLRSAKADLAAQLSAQRAEVRRLAAAKSQVERLIAQQQSALGQLRAADRARLAAQQTQVRAAAYAARATYNGPASGLAAVAVRAAYDQLGKPYQWGAAGPDSFDCSGLTMYAWGQAGVSLPHYTGAQYSAGRHVSESDLRPGDLVFFYSDLHHVGIYIGGGRFIHAPHTGTVVQIASLSGSYQSNYAGAVRVVG